MKLLRGILLMLALALPALALNGCGGTIPASAGDGGGGGAGDGGQLSLFSACTSNDQCGSGLCTQVSYDRSPTPICTYQCDANDMNPKCPSGCNPKGYCRDPM